MNAMTRRAEHAVLLQKADRYNFGRAVFALRANLMARLDDKAATLASEYCADFSAPSDAGPALLEVVSEAPVKHFVDGEEVVANGEPAHALYVVLGGVVREEFHGRVVRRCAEGDSFGEMALFAEATPSPRMVVEGGASVLRFGRKELALLGRRAPLFRPILRSLYRQQLLNRLLPPTSALAALDDTERMTLFGYFTVSLTSAGAEIVRAQVPANLLYLIASGTARRGKGDSAVLLEAGTLINEAEMLRRDVATETVEVVSSMISFTLTWEALVLVLEDLPGAQERVMQRLADVEAGRYPPPPPVPGAEPEDEIEELEVPEDLEDLDEADDDGYDERVLEEILQAREDARRK